jgi:hypothetical protein
MRLRPVILGMIFFSWVRFAAAAKDIRDVDFKNFTYPMTGPRLGHDRLKWLDASKPGQVRLVNGSDNAALPTFTFESVKFADVTGEGKEDAIVVLTFHSGGTQTSDYIYIYSFADGKPKLLAYCYTGNRSDSGLYKVYGEHRMLVVELLDYNKRSGECCSSGFVRTRYRWNGQRFEAVGAREFGAIKQIIAPD